MENKIKISILGTSDVHGYYMPWDYSEDKEAEKGGLARVSTIINEVRKQNNTILVDCGDLIQGNSAELFLERDKYPGIEVANAMNYTLFNMGNHEFNFGMDKLRKVVEQFNGVSMMGNLYRDDGHRIMNAYYIAHIDGIRIGFIGLNTPMVRTFEEKRGNLKGFYVTDPDKELEKILEIEDLKKVDALIGLFHMGYKNENNIPNTGVADVLNNTVNSDRIDIVFGGHMHQVVESKKIGKSIFVQPGVFGEAVNRVDLYFDKSKKDKLYKIETSVIEINSNIPSDPKIVKMIRPYHEELRAFSNEVVGYVEKEDLYTEDEIAGIPQSRVSQTRVVEFFLEVMRHYSHADIVATHMDNPYPGMPKGPVKRKHIYNSYRYAGGDISNYRMLGKDLKIYMEWSAGFFNQAKNGDINISFDKTRNKFKYSTFDIFGNVRYVIDIREPVGSRIKNLCFLDGKKIEDDDEIILGINKYRMDFLLSDEGPLKHKDISPFWSSIKGTGLDVTGTIRNLAMKFFDECKDKTYCPVDDIRWYIRKNDMDEKIRKKAIELINEGSLDLYKDETGKPDLSKSLNIYDRLRPENYMKARIRYRNLPEEMKKDMRIIDLIKKVI